MAFYYLASYVGDGSHANQFRPPVDGGFHSIDLRPDPTAPAGFCILQTAGTLLADARLLDLGDGLDVPLPRSVSQRLENSLGLTLDLTDRVRSVITELLILQGRQDGTRWKPLRATRKGVNRIIMGGEVIFEAPVVRGTVITESFDTGDGDTLGPDLTWSETRGDIDIVSNVASLISAGTVASARAESDLAGVDHYAEIDIVLSGSTYKEAGVCCRFSSSATTYYQFLMLRDGSSGDQQVRLGRVNGGSFTQLAISGAGDFHSSNNRVRGVADGSSLDLLIDDVSQLTDTDTNITTGTRCGFDGYRSTTGSAVTWNNFEAGDIGVATLDQEGYRFRDDDDDEAGAAWLEDQDTVTTQAVATNVRLRMLTDASGDPDSMAVKLQYKRDDEATSEWRDI